MDSSIVIRIGGEAGWGIATGADLIAQMFLKIGYHVFSSKEYCSQIKGGHNYHTIRVSHQLIYADREGVDYLLALDLETIKQHTKHVSKKGIIFYDPVLVPESKDERFCAAPVSEIEQKLGEKNIHNAVFVGALAKALGIKWEVLEQSVGVIFKQKKELQQKMIKVARESYTLVQNKITVPVSDFGSLEFWAGNEAIVQGALKASLTFHVQYPMTPVSAILHSLASEAVINKNLTVIQPEDEIAAINMALGASYAGARAMTATSGGGFSLMVESLGLASMAEIPLVIIEGQRPGPATGLPTKTEQGDLKFMLSAAQGEFPRVVIAPGNVEECYTETKRAFYLAEKYQVPVIILVDKNITESFKSVNLLEEEKKFIFDYAKKINVLSEVNDRQLNSDGLFKRYASGNQWRTLPGTANGVFTCAGDEHDEVGEITESAEIRIQMVQRRMNKLIQMQKELPPQALVGEGNDLLVVSWGSNHGAIREAVEKLNEEGKKISFLSIKYMCPFLEISEQLKSAKKIVLVEANYTGQLGELIREKTGIEIKDKILRYDGLAFTSNEIYSELKKRME